MDEDLFNDQFHSTLKQEVLKSLLTLVKWELAYSLPNENNFKIGHRTIRHRGIVKVYKDVK